MVKSVKLIEFVDPKESVDSEVLVDSIESSKIGRIGRTGRITEIGKNL